jgi:hypothetical protein
VFQYADDIAVTYQAKTFDECENNLEADIEVLNQFFQETQFELTILAPPILSMERLREMWLLSVPVHGDLVQDPTVEPPGFDLIRRECELLNRFRT